MYPSIDFTVHPLVIPARLDDDDAADFIELTNVRNRIYREIAGNDDEALSPAQLLPHYAPNPDEIRVVHVVRVDGVIVGRVGVDVPLEPGSKVAYWLIELLEAVQGRGLGRALYPLVEETARAHGRTILESWAEHPEAPGPKLAAPTGFGEIPRDRAARFYLDLGYSLEQVDRKSTLEIEAALPHVADLLARARERSAGYRVEQWTLPTPPEHAPGYAWAKSRMSTDAPAAGLEIDEETWDVDRLARHDARYIDAGQTVLVTVAIHEESGDVVAFNELVSGTDATSTTHQMDTLVLKEHRGHKLGQLVKSAGILRWRELAPGSGRIMTFNAEENRPMLDINEEIGFVPRAYIGAWKKTLES
jgi:GNAT superfamily N-acetyltransferase